MPDRIARATSVIYILIVDADGQHQPADALRLESAGGLRPVVGARAASSRSVVVASWAMFDRLHCQLSHGTSIPGSTSGLRRGDASACLSLCTCSRMDFPHRLRHLAFVRAGCCALLSRSSVQQREGTSKIRLCSRRRAFRADPAISHLQPTATVCASQRHDVRRRCALRRGRSSRSHTSPTPPCQLIPGSLIILLMGPGSKANCRDARRGRRS